MEIEKNLIGSLIKNPEYIPEVYDILKPIDFKNNNSGLVYATLLDMVKGDEHIDIVTVSKKLLGEIDLAWISESTDSAMSTVYSKKHAKIISDSGRAKRLSIKLKSLSGSIDNPDDALTEMLDIYSSELSGDTKSGHIKDVIKRFNKLVTENSKSDYGIETGYEFLEQKYIRYMPGHIWIIGGFTSTGKTAVMADMICRVIDLKDPTMVIISTEMKEEQNVARFLSRQTGFHSQVMLSGCLHESKVQEMKDSLKWFDDRNIYLYDNLYSFQDIEMRLRQLKMKTDIDIVYIDYIQNMTFNGAKSEYESKSEIAKGIQRIAKQLNTCIVCLSQISNSAARDDGDEVLEYKGAGEIAAVADIGIRLKRDKDNRENLMFVIKKNRHGAIGVQVLRFVNNFTRLKEIIHEENE